MCEKNNTFLAFVLGGIIGAAFGILYAPKSGREMRADLKKAGQDFADTVNDLGQEVKDAGFKAYQQGKNKVLSKKAKMTEAFEEGKKVFEKYVKD